MYEWPNPKGRISQRPNTINPKNQKAESIIKQKA